MVGFLRAQLVKTTELGEGDTVTALSETAVRFNETSWFWADDNAKAAELLCEPRLYDQDPAVPNAAIDFVLRMSDGDVIRRRAGRAELRVVSDDPAAFRIETAFTILEGDLTQGIVRQALRFNDNRTMTVAQHGAAPVSLRLGWLPMRFRPASSISGWAITATAEAATLCFTSSLRGPGGLVAEMRHSCTIEAARPFLTFEVRLVPAPGRVLEEVVMGTALDRMHQSPDVHYKRVGIRRGGVDRFVTEVRGRDMTLHEGPAELVAATQGGASPGFSYGIHCLLEDGARLARVGAREFRRGRILRMRHAYRMGRVTGEGAVLRERRMVTGGGYYDALGHYEAVLRGPGADGGTASSRAGDGTADPGMTYDIGAELNAVAVHLLFARHGRYAVAPDAARVAALTAWYDRHVERYFGFIRPGSADAVDRVFTRGLAFVVLSLDCMVRATGGARYRSLLAEGVRLILATQRPAGEGGTFGDTWAWMVPFLDNHAACILALARASWHGDADGAIARAVHVAVRSIRLHGGTIDVGAGHMVEYDGLAVLNPPGLRPHVDSGFWSYKLGVVLRALRAVLAAAAAVKLGATEEERAAASLRIAVAEAQLLPCCRWHGGQMEVLTSCLAGETNSETQPWVALGLVPALDEAIVALGA